MLSNYDKYLERNKWWDVLELRQGTLRLQIPVENIPEAPAQSQGSEWTSKRSRSWQRNGGSGGKPRQGGEEGSLGGKRIRTRLIYFIVLLRADFTS